MRHHTRFLFVVVSLPLDLAGPNELLGPPLAVAFDSATVVLLADNFGAGTLAVGRITADGRIATSVHAIAIAPRLEFGAYGMARRGPDVVVAWSRAGVRIARLTP